MAGNENRTMYKGLYQVFSQCADKFIGCIWETLVRGGNTAVLDARNVATKATKNSDLEISPKYLSGTEQFENSDHCQRIDHDAAACVPPNVCE